MVVKWIITALLLIATFGVTSTPAYSSTVPTIPIRIQYNPATGHTYFNPTFPCLYGDKAYVQLTNKTTSQVRIGWYGSPSQITLPPNKTVKSLNTAQYQLEWGRDPEIDVTMAIGTQTFIAAEANIIAEAVVPGCYGRK